MISVDWMRCYYWERPDHKYEGFVNTRDGVTDLEVRDSVESFHEGFKAEAERKPYRCDSLMSLVEYHVMCSKREGYLWKVLAGDTKEDEYIRGFRIVDRGTVYDRMRREPAKIDRYAAYPPEGWEDVDHGEPMATHNQVKKLREMVIKINADRTREEWRRKREEKQRKKDEWKKQMEDKKMREETVNKYFLDCITDEDGYGFEDEKEALTYLRDRFKEEKKDEIWKIGNKRAFGSWIWGLPSCFHMDIYDEEIRRLMDEWEVPYDKEKALSDEWATLMYGVFVRSCKKNGVVI